ncbi:MAG: transcriptional regulator, partial [Chloroflexota bacterium]
LITAQSFLDSPHINVLLPGGRLRRDSISIVGSPEGLPDVNLNIGFFGARGISWSGGVSDVDGDEVTIKQAMVRRSVLPVVLVDGSKWGQVAPYTFISSNQVRHIITTSDAPKELVEQFRRQGARVDVVSAR